MRAACGEVLCGVSVLAEPVSVARQARFPRPCRTLDHRRNNALMLDAKCVNRAAVGRSSRPVSAAVGAGS